MGDVGDYWRAAKEDKAFFESHGHWPGQKVCKACGIAYHPNGKDRHAKCRHCAQAWSQGYELVGRWGEDNGRT